jgi:hypothetical protein
MVNDPVNLETILSTRFEDFGLGARREGLLPLLGEGISHRMASRGVTPGNYYGDNSLGLRRAS